MIKTVIEKNRMWWMTMARSFFLATDMVSLIKYAYREQIALATYASSPCRNYSDPCCEDFMRNDLTVMEAMKNCNTIDNEVINEHICET